MLDSKIVDALVDKHRRVALRQLALILPVCVVLLTLRGITLIPAGLCFACLKALDRFFKDKDPHAWYVIVFVLLALLVFIVLMVPVILDQIISDASAKRRLALITTFKILNGKRLRSALTKVGGFLLYLRNFQPSDSEPFKYRPLIGATQNYGHRDSYVFAGVSDYSGRLFMPMIAIANPRDGLTSNSAFTYLFLDDRHWQDDLKELLRSAVGIVVVVENSGVMGQLLSSRDLDSAKGYLADFRDSKWERHGRSVALEISWIIQDDALRSKTLIAGAFVDGGPDVKSTWRSLSDFRNLESREVRELLKRWCSVTHDFKDSFSPFRFDGRG